MVCVIGFAAPVGGMFTVTLMMLLAEHPDGSVTNMLTGPELVSAFVDGLAGIETF